MGREMNNLQGGQQDFNSIGKCHGGSGEGQQAGADDQEDQPQGIESSLHKAFLCNPDAPEFHPDSFARCEEQVQQEGQDNNQTQRF